MKKHSHTHTPHIHPSDHIKNAHPVNLSACVCLRVCVFVLATSSRLESCVCAARMWINVCGVCVRECARAQKSRQTDKYVCNLVKSTLATRTSARRTNLPHKYISKSSSSLSLARSHSLLLLHAHDSIRVILSISFWRRDLSHSLAV